MSDVVIKAENLGKKYTIGHQAENGRYVALRDVLVHNAKSLWYKTKDLVSGKPIIQGDTTEDVWALKDVNFEINRGEAVGIIGRNGAGKSTLLKILSRITEPTTGRITIKGRVASLLEVGTGFHPELTGRENIYLNGTILGMTRVEIKKKFDEIVAFAEIEKFLDTPVKRYSSGMYVRLAFAVAAHLEPEILVIDEVLSVGDAQFQKKCLGKMDDVSTKEGRTVLFVSHNMETIKHLCNKGVLFNKGAIVISGPIIDVVSCYEEEIYSTRQGSWTNDEKSRKGVYLEKIELHDDNGIAKSDYLNSESINILIHTYTIETTDNVAIGFDLIKDGIVVFRTRQADSMLKKCFVKGEKNVFVCKIPKWLLNVGEYFLRPFIAIHCVEVLTSIDTAVLSFKISLDTGRSEFHIVLNEVNHPGAVFPMLEWTAMK